MPLCIPPNTPSWRGDQLKITGKLYILPQSSQHYCEEYNDNDDDNNNKNNININNNNQTRISWTVCTLPSAAQ
jgi:hypothetical protein